MIIGFVNKHGNTFLKRSALFVKPADSLLCKLPEYTWLLPPTKRIFVNLAVTWVILCSVERVKRFVKVDSYCIVSNLKRISKMSTLLSMEKFLWTPMSSRKNSVK